MRKTLTSTAVAGLLLAVGPTAHASPTAQAAPAAKGKTLAAWRTAANQPTFAALTWAALASPAAALAPGITQDASGQVPTSAGRIATLLERALHRAGFVRVSDRRLIAADGRLLKDVRSYASPASACSRAFYLPSALPDPRVTTAPRKEWGTVSWKERGGEVALYLDSSRCPAGGWSAQLTILKQNAGR